MLTLAIIATIFLGFLSIEISGVIFNGDNEERYVMKATSFSLLVIPLLFAIVTIWILYAR